MTWSMQEGVASLTPDSATVWSALTCKRFGRLRPVAAVEIFEERRNIRRSPREESGDRSPRPKR